MDSIFTQQYDLSKVNKHKSILIVGSGSNNNRLNKVMYCSTMSVPQIQSIYGTNSQLSKAFETVKTIGATDIFLMNIQRKTDYYELANIVRHYDFAYIVPLGIYFSDTFFDATKQKVITVSISS